MDRAFRSTEDAIKHERRLRDRGITLKAMSMVIDTSTADGNQAYQTRAVSAEHERKKISERTLQGLKATVLRGSILGRPRKMTKRQVLAAINKINAGAEKQKVAAYYNVHPETLRRSIKRFSKS